MKILFYKEDFYTLFCMFIFSFLLLLPFFYSISMQLYPFWLLLSFHFSFCVNLINHNHSHTPIFKNSMLNNLFDYWLTLLRGGSAIFIKIIHNINHHQHVGSKEDWFSPLNQKGGNTLIGSLTYIFYTFKSFRNGAKEFYSKMGKDFRRHQKIEKFILILFISILLILSAKKFFLFVLPSWIFGNSFLVYTNLIFHKNCSPEDKYNNSYNFTNLLENTLYFNGGYHTIHHSNPTLHWSLLPSKHQEVIDNKINQKFVKNSMLLHAIKLNLGNKQSEYFRK